MITTSRRQTCIGPFVAPFVAHLSVAAHVRILIFDVLSFWKLISFNADAAAKLSEMDLFWLEIFSKLFVALNPVLIQITSARNHPWLVSEVDNFIRTSA